MSHEHYFIDVSAYDRVDVYRLIELAGITCPVAQHVFKKAFATGKRGHKSLCKDWQDIADSAARRLQMMDEDDGWTAEAIRAASFGQINTIDYRTDAEKGFTDPRTVAGLDVSFPTEKHMSFAPEQCECHRCIEEKGLKVGPLPLSSVKMILCPACGNKRCPKANDHRNECSGSNEPGQPGSAYR